MKKAFTLIELVMVIAVFAIAITPVLILMANLNQRVIQARLTTSAVILGRDILEEILSKRYDENIIYPWSNHLGPESGESRSSYDDVDDFDGLVDTNASFPGFSRRVNVCYIDPDNRSLDRCLPDSSRTDYKRVDVIVSHNLIGDINFSVIVSSEYPQ